MSTVFSARDASTWRATSLPLADLPEPGPALEAAAILGRVAAALGDEALPVAAARQLFADTLACFQAEAAHEAAAHDTVTAFTTTECEAEAAATRRLKAGTSMERLDIALGRVAQLLQAAEERDREAERRVQHEAAVAQRQAVLAKRASVEAALVAYKAERQALRQTLRQANADLPEDGEFLEFPTELNDSYTVASEELDLWCQQRPNGELVPAPAEQVAVDDDDATLGFVPSLGHVRLLRVLRTTLHTFGEAVDRVQLTRAKPVDPEAEAELARARASRAGLAEALEIGAQSNRQRAERILARDKVAELYITNGAMEPRRR